MSVAVIHDVGPTSFVLATPFEIFDAETICWLGPEWANSPLQLNTNLESVDVEQTPIWPPIPRVSPPSAVRTVPANLVVACAVVSAHAHAPATFVPANTPRMETSVPVTVPCDLAVFVLETSNLGIHVRIQDPATCRLTAQCGNHLFHIRSHSMAVIAVAPGATPILSGKSLAGPLALAIPCPCPARQCAHLGLRYVETFKFCITNVESIFITEAANYEISVAGEVVLAPDVAVVEHVRPGGIMLATNPESSREW